MYVVALKGVSKSNCLHKRVDKGWFDTEGKSTAQPKVDESVTQEAVKMDCPTTSPSPPAPSIAAGAPDTLDPDLANSTEAAMTEEQEAHHLYETAAKTTILKKRKAFLVLMCVL